MMGVLQILMMAIVMAVQWSDLFRFGTCVGGMNLASMKYALIVLLLEIKLFAINCYMQIQYVHTYIPAEDPRPLFLGVERMFMILSGESGDPDCRCRPRGGDDDIFIQLLQLDELA